MTKVSKTYLVYARQALVWLAHSSTVPKPISRQLTEFVCESIQHGFVSDANESDIAILSGLGECKSQALPGDENIVLPRTALLAVATLENQARYNVPPQIVANLLAFTHGVIKQGVGVGEHDWKILLGASSIKVRSLVNTLELR